MAFNAMRLERYDDGLRYVYQWVIRDRGVIRWVSQTFMDDNMAWTARNNGALQWFDGTEPRFI